MADKKEHPTSYPEGKVIIQRSGRMTGKTTKANAWKAEAPERRRVIEGDEKLAEAYAKAGYDVMLNLNN